MLKVARGVLVGVLCLFLFVSGHVSAKMSDNIDTSVDIKPSVTVTVPDRVSLDLNPSSSDFDSGVVNVRVGTNNPTGYQLVMTAPSTDLTSAENGEIISTLPTLAGGYTEENFVTNKWGYKKGNTNYLPFETNIPLLSSEQAATADNINLTFGAKVDYLQPAGSYELTLSFNAVANYLPEYIQDLDEALCTTSPLTVVDYRDDEEYVVQRLADGKCWMLDNLRLDPTDSSVQNKLNIDTTNATNEALRYLKNGGGSSPYTNYAVSNVWEDAYQKPIVMTTYKNTVASTTYGSGSGKIGVYYNVCAASAGTYCYTQNNGTGNVTSDICPAGWRMPNDSEYLALANVYTNTTATSSDSLQYNLSTPLSGMVTTNGAIDYQGSRYYSWDSTYNGVNSLRNLYVAASAVYPQDSSYRYRGFNVRCVRKKDVSTMQDLGTAPQDDKTIFIESMVTGKIYTIKDARDDETYSIAKLADGNVWLLDNLRLDPTEVTLDKLKGNTNAPDNILEYFKNGGGSSPYSSGGVIADNPSSSYNQPRVITSGANGGWTKNTVANVKYGNASGKIGVFYNYCAASAGSYCYAQGTSTGNAQYDICPSGWKMPSSGSSESGSYGYLYGTGYPGNPNNFKTAFSVALSGGCSSATLSGNGDYAEIWSSDWSTQSYWDIDEMMILFVTDSSVDPYFSNGRALSLSVRCVLK